MLLLLRKGYYSVVVVVVGMVLLLRLLDKASQSLLRHRRLDICRCCCFLNSRRDSRPLDPYQGESPCLCGSAEPKFVG
jgi:hypothetical protein